MGGKYHVELLEDRRCRITFQPRGLPLLPGRAFSLDDPAFKALADAVGYCSSALNVGDECPGLGCRPVHDQLMVDEQAWDQQMQRDKSPPWSDLDNELFGTW